MASKQIKQDLNRSGWETSDFPSACEDCLGSNPYVQMLKEDHGAECNICTRPYSVFKWKVNRTARSKKTMICLSCARLKNACQSCMKDLAFGLPLQVRDAALRIVAPGPESSINREYYAQNQEKAMVEGTTSAIEEYEKTDEKARDLLRRLANSEPYYKKQRRLEAEEGDTTSESKTSSYGPGPVRTQDSRRGGPTGRGGRGGSRGGRPFPGTAALPPQPEDILPPSDPNITSLFVTGVEDDLPEHAIRTFFTPFGQIRSLICSHRSHCAFINYATREGAEAAAEHCQGRAVIKGCPLRVKWGKPRPLDSTDRDQRMEWAREGRQTAAAVKGAQGGQKTLGGGELSGQTASTEEEETNYVVAPPPGSSNVTYASLSGD